MKVLLGNLPRNSNQVAAATAPQIDADTRGVEFSGSQDI